MAEHPAEDLLHEIFASSVARRGRDLDLLLRRAVMLAGTTILDASVVFPDTVEIEQELYASVDVWSETERHVIAARLEAILNTPIYYFADEGVEVDGHRQLLMTFGSDDTVPLSDGRFHGIAAVDTYVDDEGLLMPGDESALIAMLDSTDRIDWALRFQLPDPAGERRSGIAVGIEALARRIMHLVSGRADGIGPGHDSEPLEIPPLFDD